MTRREAGTHNSKRGAFATLLLFIYTHTHTYSRIYEAQLSFQGLFHASSLYPFSPLTATQIAHRFTALPLTSPSFTLHSPTGVDHTSTSTSTATPERANFMKLERHRFSSAHPALYEQLANFQTLLFTSNCASATRCRSRLVRRHSSKMKTICFHEEKKNF